MTELERKIGYEFRDAALLKQALTTPACRMDHPEGGVFPAPRLRRLLRE